MLQFENLTPEEIAILIPRMQDEQNARYFYEVAWAWCRRNGYHNASKYYKCLSKIEGKEYKWIAKILTDWGAIIEFPAISAPKNDFADLMELMENEYTMQLNMSKAYNADGIRLFPMNQILYRKLLITQIHEQKNKVEVIRQRIEKARNYIIGDPKLADFENSNF